MGEIHFPIPAGNGMNGKTSPDREGRRYRSEEIHDRPSAGLGMTA